MKITDSGIPVGGVAGDGVFVGRTRIKDGGTATTDGTRAVYQSAAGTVESCAFDGSNAQPILNQGATLIVAGGGHWAVFLQGPGVVTSWGLRLPLAAVVQMLDSGHLLVLSSYGSGVGLAMYPPGATDPLWSVDDAAVSFRYPYPQAFALDTERVIWGDPEGRLHTRGLPAPKQVELGAIDPFLVEAPDGRILVGYHTWRAVLHPIDDASKGYVLSEGLTYGTTATGHTVGWSLTPSESKMVTLAVDLAAPLVSLAPPVVVPPPVVMPPVVAPQGPMLIAGAFFVNDKTPGNAAVWVSRNGFPMFMPTTQAIIAAPELADKVPAGRLLGIWGDSPANIQLAATIALRLSVPIFAYCDARKYYALTDVQQWCGAAKHIACPQAYIDCYGKEGEPFDLFVQEMLAELTKLRDVPCVPVVRVTRGGVPFTIAADRVARAMNALAVLVSEKLNDRLGHLLFAWDRGDGVTGEPALEAFARGWLEVETTLNPNNAREWAAEFCAPVVTPPPVVVIPPPPPPVVPPVPPIPPVPPMTDPVVQWNEKSIASAIKIAYDTLLHRPPDPDGLVFYTKQLQSGWTVEQMEADIKGGNEYKALHPPAPVPGTLTLPSLSIVGKEFRDNGALWVPRMASCLSPLRRSAAEQITVLDRNVANGHNGARAFAGELTWANQTPASALAALPGFLDRCAERGLAVELACLTDTGTGYDCEAHLNAIGAIVEGRKYVLCEVWNEYKHSTQRQDISVETSIEWGKKYFGSRGILWAVGAAGVDEPDPQGVYPTAGGSYCTAHLDRGRPSWNNVRRAREIYAVAEAAGVPCIDNEPMGADELDGSVTGKQRWNDPALFYTLGALDRAFATGGGVHHSQAGLYAVLPGPVQQQCALAYVAGQLDVAAALAPRGSYKNVGHGGSPFASATFVDGGSEDGVVRAYSFVSGNAGVSVLVGLKGNASLEWTNGWRQVREVGRRTAQDGRSVAVLEITK